VELACFLRCAADDFMQEMGAQLYFAVHLRPDDPVLIEKLGTHYLYNRNEPEAALRCFDAALERAASTPMWRHIEFMVRLSRSRALQELGRLDEAHED